MEPEFKDKKGILYSVDLYTQGGNDSRQAESRLYQIIG